MIYVNLSTMLKALLLTVLITLTSSCSQNTRINKDDTPIRVTLDRSFVRQNSIGLARNPVLGCNFKCLNAIFNISRGYITPKDYPEYKQPIYWGDTVVYFPSQLKNKKWSITVQFRGNHLVQLYLDVDLSKSDNIQLVGEADVNHPQK